jgi:hypothetical protein
VHSWYTHANLIAVHTLECPISSCATAGRGGDHATSKFRFNLRTRAILPRAAGAALALLFVLARGVAPAIARDPSVLPIAFQIAQDAGHPVVDRAFLDDRVARANQIFAAYGVQFVAAGAVPLAGERAAIETAADRDVLGANVRRGVINCFVVGSLRDVDDPAQMRRGVHWHSRAYPGTHYVVLSSIAGPNVLAHELGHFLGNPRHSDVPGNLMSYQRTDALPFLDPTQAQRVARSVRDYLRSGELRAAAEPRSEAAR